MTQRDVMLRWIEQVARLVARLLRKGGDSDLDEASEQIERALMQHLGPVAPLVPRLDPASAAGLLSDPDRIFAYARLLALQASVQAGRHDPGALATRQRAIQLGREALTRSRQPPAEWQRWIGEAERGDATGLETGEAGGI